MDQHESEKFQLLWQAALDGIIVHERGVVKAVNRRATMMFAAPERAMLGRSVLEFTSPEFHSTVLERIGSHSSEPFESIGVRDDGSTFPLQVCGVSSDASPIRIVVLRDLTEQKRAEEIARQHEALCQAVVQAAFDGIVTMTGECVNEANEHFARMFGYTRDELVGMNVGQLIERDPNAGVRGGALGLRKNGRSFPIEFAIGVTGDARAVCAVRDVTSERRAQEQLVESERRYRELSEATHDLLCEHDLEGNILDINPAVIRALGYTREEILACNLREFIDPLFVHHFDSYRERIVRYGLAEGLLRVRTREGEERIWHCRTTLRASGRERPVVRGLARDVTDRELATRALRKSEHHFRSILEHISDTVTIVDGEGMISYHSPSLERLLDLPEGEITNRRFVEFVHRDDVDAVTAFFDAQFHGSSEASMLDARLHHRDGSWRWFSMVATTRNVGGKRTLLVNGRDDTEKRMLLAQLEQANRVNSLGRLAATVAHEFNNVLMSMQPFAELMQRPGVDMSTVSRGARSIINSIARGKRVSLDILRFTHPAQPTLAPVELRTWWDRVAPELASLAGGIEVACALPPRMAVTADAAQLTQIVSNLLSNARDAMPHGGCVQIEARRPERNETFAFGVVRDAHKFVQLTVRDTGSGMGDDVVRHAFEPLFTTKLNGGTGLGLAVVHQIVTRHGGAIFIASKPNRGTTFHIFLPVASTVEVEEIEPVSVSLDPLRVLVIDDEPAIAGGLAELLKEFGATTEAAMSRDEAKLVADKFQPDLAVIDVRLHDGNGFELGAQLRWKLPQLKLVYVSGHADGRTVPASETGTSFLQKPFEIGQLVEQIAELTA
jgi:two-component system, cell cycle sensor histidine kinase and response regulator CckA